MIYPRLKHEEDRRRKLSLKQIDEIIELHAEGMSYRKIAEIYPVSKTAIRYYCVNEDVRDKMNKDRYKLLVAQENRDSEFKKKRHQDKMDSHKDLLKRSAAKRKYKGEATYKWKKKKYHTDEVFRKKTLEQASRRYYRRREDAQWE